MLPDHVRPGVGCKLALLIGALTYLWHVVHQLTATAAVAWMPQWHVSTPTKHIRLAPCMLICYKPSVHTTRSVKAMDGSMNLEQALEQRLAMINCTPSDIKAFIKAYPPESRLVPVSPNSILLKGSMCCFIVSTAAMWLGVMPLSCWTKQQSSCLCILLFTSKWLTCFCLHIKPK